MEIQSKKECISLEKKNGLQNTTVLTLYNNSPISSIQNSVLWQQFQNTHISPRILHLNFRTLWRNMTCSSFVGTNKYIQWKNVTFNGRAIRNINFCHNDIALNLLSKIDEWYFATFRKRWYGINHSVHTPLERSWLFLTNDPHLPIFTNIWSLKYAIFVVGFRSILINSMPR